MTREKKIMIAALIVGTIGCITIALLMHVVQEKKQISHPSFHAIGQM